MISRQRKKKSNLRVDFVYLRLLDFIGVPLAVYLAKR